MIKKRKTCNTYPKEFMLEALRMMDESDRPTCEIATKLGIRRKGECLDNAVAGSFFGSLKIEFVYHEDNKSKAEAR